MAAEAEGSTVEVDDDDEAAEESLMPNFNVVKLILLGDSAVGKSKLVERFLRNDYKPHQFSTNALTLFRHTHTRSDGGDNIPIDIWDTAGQDRFNELHSSFFYGAHCCIMVFDVTRKVTYKHLEQWYGELREFCPSIPAVVVANKIDIDYKVAEKAFAFPTKHDLPLYYVSASDGTNVMRLFQEAIEMAIEYKESPEKDLYDDVIDIIQSLDSKASVSTES